MGRLLACRMQSLGSSGTAKAQQQDAQIAGNMERSYTHVASARYDTTKVVRDEMRKGRRGKICKVVEKSHGFYK